MKPCIHCQQIKPLDSFRKNKRGSGGRENVCKSCAAKRRRERYAADSTLTLEQNRRWQAQNRPAIAELSRQWIKRKTLENGVHPRTVRRKTEIDTLSDSYVRQIIVGRSALRHQDIPQSMVDAHRLVLQIKRASNEKRT
jgi:hypothetical protein